MYYSHPCSYCAKTFYVYSNDRYDAAKQLYEGIKKHLTDYNEDDKEHQFDDGPEIDTNEVLAAMTESQEQPQGGYQL